MCNFAQTQRRDGTNDMSFHSPALVPSLPPKWALLRRQSPPPSASSPLATPSHLRTGRRQLPPRQRPTAGRSLAASARSPHPPQVGLELGDGGACGKLVSSASPPPPSLLSCSGDTFPADPGSARLSSRLHPSPSEPNATGRREVEARHPPRVRPCSPRPPLAMLGRVRACVHVCVCVCARGRLTGRTEDDSETLVRQIHTSLI